MAAKIYHFHATDAARESILLRAALCGPTGSGKTKTGLILGSRIVERLGIGPLYVIDSESRSALRYAYSPRSKQGYRFKHVPMPEDDFSPAAYTAALDYCESQGAGVILIDSLSHAWNGINGVLEQVDLVSDRSRSKNTFSEGWKTMTPIHNRLIQRVLSSSAHVIFTLRAKVDWVVQENERGKREPMKVGLAPIQREGIDYEPDLFFDMTVPDNNLIVGKSRCDRLTPGEAIKRPGPEFADVVIEWMKDCEPAAGARTLGEAICTAVGEGIAAAEARSPDKYKEAKRKLVGWCESAGVGEARRDTALLQFKERVALITGPKNVAPIPLPPPSSIGLRGVPTEARPGLIKSAAPIASDEDRLRAIDEGRA
jgi:AAA domain